MSAFERQTTLARLRQQVDQKRQTASKGAAGKLSDVEVIQRMYPDPSKQRLIAKKLAGMSEFEKQTTMARMRQAFEKKAAAGGGGRRISAGRDATK
eukprot:SAG22_NODE_2266_length_2771_cov_2.265719_2_plen_96_part_00